MSDNRRSIKNVFVNPKQQFRYSFILLIASCVTLAFFIGVLIYQINQTVVAIALAYRLDAEVVTAVQQSLISALWVSMLLSGFMIVVTLAVSIAFSHKVYGPVVAIKRCMESLAQGDYKARLTLRKGDDLLEIRDALNQLAESLEKRHAQ